MAHCPIIIPTVLMWSAQEAPERKPAMHQFWRRCWFYWYYFCEDFGKDTNSAPVVAISQISFCGYFYDYALIPFLKKLFTDPGRLNWWMHQVSRNVRLSFKKFRCGFSVFVNISSEKWFINFGHTLKYIEGQTIKLSQKGEDKCIQ